MNQKVKTADKTSSYTIPSFYNFYLDQIEKDTIYDIPYSTYRKVITDYFKYLRDEFIENAKCVKLPNRLGSIQIIKHKPKYYDKRSLRIDYQATKQLNKLVFLTNLHSDMFKYRCYWNKGDVLIKNKTKYQLVMTRANKRHLAQLIKSKQQDFEEL